MATIDDIINGTFQAIGAPPSYLSPAYNPADYASIYAQPAQTYQPGMLGRGQPARLSTASAAAAADRLAAGSPGLPLNTTGQYNALNPFVMSALSAQQGATPAMPTMASRVTGYGTPRAAMLPVNTMTPEIEAAYADRTPAGRKKLAYLLADAAQAGNIGTASTKGSKATGGLASLITGQGTPRASGGLFGLLFGGGGGASASMGGPAPRSTATGTSTDGYVYSNGQRTGVAPQYAGMSPSKMYDAINAAAGNRTSSGTRSSFDDNQEMGRANYSLASSRN